MWRFIIALLLFSCNTPIVERESNNPAKLFLDIPSTESGLTFNNKIVETKEVNYFKYVYLYNGGGVGIGDINNDNLPDVYMTSTQGVDKLFLNKGNMKFADISTAAGINQYPGQKTGVTMVDINNDGWMDIYVCRAGWLPDANTRRNLLFINNKDNTFKESAAAYGLDDIGHSTQAAFFDYDNDGDLDLYVANHPGEFHQPLTEMVNKINDPDLEMSDKLYRNNSDGTFTDVTDKAGISNYGYGLGLAIGDLNKDGWQDIYVANDFETHDYYYVNNGDGTFTESLKEFFPHCSYFAMGNDLVDINNDGFLDLFTVEMLSEDNMRQKTMMAPMDLDRFSYLVNSDLHYQYMRNSLQINNGNGYFSDIAYYAGLDKTDWSWGTLFGDYDNDGDNDIVVVNGFLRDTQDKDFSKKTNELAEKSQNRLTFEQAYALLKSTPVENFAFENLGDYKFNKVSEDWGFNFSGFSNGVAYGDLDRDGDLDIIVSNINNDLSFYENTSNNEDFIAFTLIGPDQNKSAIHTQLTLYTSTGKQFKDFQVTRGFQSSCDHIIHFGLKPNTVIDSLFVKWPDGKVQTIKGIKKGTYHTLTYDPDLEYQEREINENYSQLFKDITGTEGIDFKHKEIYYNDYEREVLLPHLLSQLGPALTVADVDNDGLDDFYIGGAHQQSAELYLQKRPGYFTKSAVSTWSKDAAFEDIDAVFIDYDKDGDLDLYVVSGSNQFDENSPLLKDRFYKNVGNGNFVRDEQAIPNITSSGGCVIKIDFDNDGDEDLFVGGRIVPGNYPVPAPSYLLENIGGQFKEVTAEKAAELQQPGLITAALATDFDNDGDQDLIVVGEWTDIQFYKNTDGQFELVKDKMGLKNHVGWWNTIKAADLNGDGNVDYILGNLGLNYKYQATDDQPFQVYSADFDNNGQRDIVIGYYASDEKLYPVRGLQCSSEQIPDLKKKFPTYEAFGKADVFEVYGEALEDALNYQANDFSSIILWNKGDGSFTSSKLPVEAQLAPIQDFIITDINKDNLPDIIAAGNWFVAEIETPRADNGTGLVMINKGDKSFEVQTVRNTGFFANKDVRNMGMLYCGEDHPALILVANNNSQLQLFEYDDKKKVQ